MTKKETDRFFSKIFLEGCGLRWRGGIRGKGYGCFSIMREGRTVLLYAHRIAYKIFNGSDPGDQLVRHACDTPPCVTPDCLLLGSMKENMRDAMERGRANFDGLTAFHEASSAAVRARILAGEKPCSWCMKTKPFDRFGVDKKSADGRDYTCRSCRGERRQSRGRW